MARAPPVISLSPTCREVALGRAPLRIRIGSSQTHRFFPAAGFHNLGSSTSSLLPRTDISLAYLLYVFVSAHTLKKAPTSDGCGVDFQRAKLCKKKKEIEKRMKTT